MVKEVSPYEADLDWDDVTEPDEMLPLVARPRPRDGQGALRVRRRAPSSRWSTSDVEDAIIAVIGGRDDEFARDLAAFGADYGALTRDDHRRFVDAFRNGMIRGVDGGLTMGWVRLIAPLLLGGGGRGGGRRAHRGRRRRLSRRWPTWQAIAVPAAAFVVPALLSAAVTWRFGWAQAILWALVFAPPCSSRSCSGWASFALGYGP